MKIVRLSNNCATIACIGLSCSPSFQQNEITSNDHLNQWNEGPVKASILSFLNTVFNETCPDFVAVKDRVAVFDMDGTILLEKPNFVLFDFVMRRLLEYSKDAPVSLQMIVNHDDSIREYFYEVEKMKNLCQKQGWQEISMKNDFKLIIYD